jgi:hypothetical protein
VFSEVPKPFLAWLLFKGLPSAFDSFSSRKYEELAKDIKAINISKLISDLISEESRMKASIDLKANKAGSNKDSYYKHCKRKSHVESNCYKKYSELKPKNKANKPSSKKSKKKSDKENSKNSSNKDNNNKAESSKVIMNILSNNQTIEDNISLLIILINLMILKIS